MRGLGRRLALPILLIALAVQSLAPAEAAAMRPDPAAMGICSAHELVGGSHRPDPLRSRDHDCCAFACALANLTAAPPVPAFAARHAFAASVALAPAHRADAPAASPLARPRARGPPSSTLTI